MTHLTLLAVLGILLTMSTNAEPTTRPLPEGIPLFPNGAPGAKGTEPADQPVLFPFHAENPNGTAVIVVPGGGYGHLAIDHEGWQVAKWLNSHNISAFVLRYRYAPYRHPVPLGDGMRAVRLVRANAKDWKIDPSKIGMLGFSAGGHLTSSVGTHFNFASEAIDEVDKASARPDFMVLIYPVITMTPQFTHPGSRKNLLGENPDAELIDLMSNEKQVTRETPPTFLVHSTTDKGVPCQNSQLFHEACQTHGVTSKFILFNVGAHGYELGGDDPQLSTWPGECINWMKEIGMTRGSE